MEIDEKQHGDHAHDAGGSSTQTHQTINGFGFQSHDSYQLFYLKK